MSLRKQQREATITAIKAAAHKQMAAEGTAAISLRGIARDLGITAPAIYRYFPSRDDLITALLVDAFNAIADAMIAAEASVQPRDDYAGRLIAVLLIYRAWALEHPLDFQLIYGNPIPGYSAPAEVTVPAARRAFIPIVTVLSEALAAGVLKLPLRLDDLPDAIVAHLYGLVERDSYPELPLVLYVGATGWERIHGMVTLELFHQTQPLVGDTAAHYRFEIGRMCAELGLILS